MIPFNRKFLKEVKFLDIPELRKNFQDLLSFIEENFEDYQKLTGTLKIYDFTTFRNMSIAYWGFENTELTHTYSIAELKKGLIDTLEYSVTEESMINAYETMIKIGKKNNPEMNLDFIYNQFGNKEAFENLLNKVEKILEQIEKDEKIMDKILANYIKGNQSLSKMIDKTAICIVENKECPENAILSVKIYKFDKNLVYSTDIFWSESELYSKMKYDEVLKEYVEKFHPELEF